MINIKFSSKQALSIANDLDEQSERLLDVARKDLNEKASMLSTYWKGEASVMFTNNCLELENEIIEQAKRLQNIAARIRNSSKEIERKEKEISTLFKGN